MILALAWKQKLEKSCSKVVFASLIPAKLTQIWRTSCLRIAWRILHIYDRKLKHWGRGWVGILVATSSRNGQCLSESPVLSQFVIIITKLFFHQRWLFIWLTKFCILKPCNCTTWLPGGGGGVLPYMANTGMCLKTQHSLPADVLWGSFVTHGGEP